MPFVVQNMFILVAPAIFAASVYMTLGRIVTSIAAEKHSPLRPSRLTATFLLGDILSFLIQGGSAGMMVVQNADLAKWGERLVIIGLAVQIVVFAIFCVVSIIFHRRVRHAPTQQSFDNSIPWEATLYMLYAVSFLIMVRSIFRVIEYAQGHTGYSLSHEWTLYVFDSLLMFAVTAIFAWRFPSELRARRPYEDVLMHSPQHSKH